MVCHSSAYKRMYRRNSIDETSTGTFVIWQRCTCSIDKWFQNVYYIVLGKSFSIDGNLNWYTCGGFSSRGLFYPVKKTCKVIAYLSSHVSHKCVLVYCDEKTYIVRVANKQETEQLEGNPELTLRVTLWTFNPHLESWTLNSRGWTIGLRVKPSALEGGTLNSRGLTLKLKGKTLNSWGLTLVMRVKPWVVESFTLNMNLNFRKIESLALEIRVFFR